jgi:3',5'-nucleoside bisphosphate phosphatase
VDTFRAEFHVHTLLSPCAEVEMIPPLIVQEALERGINLIAITDHNASGNVAAVQKAAALRYIATGANLVVLPGMELQSREEVHILCLFDHLDQLETLQIDVDRELPHLENDIEHFGEQFVVDETGEFIRRETRLLITSVDLSFEQVVHRVNDLGGLAIPAHIDRKAYGLIENLGFVPQDIEVEALEISRRLIPEDAWRKFPQISRYPLIRGGDVHRLEEFLGANEIQVEAATIAEIRLAIRNAEGRSLTVYNDRY